MSEIYMLVGLPGANKSPLAEDLAMKHNAEIISTRMIREACPNLDNDEVHDVLQREVWDILGEGKNCVVDSTNIKSINRRRFLQSLFGLPCKKNCVIVATPLEVCLNNNATRFHPIPDEVIINMHKQWTTPAHWEGWNSIWIYYENHDWMGMKGKPTKFVSEYLHWDQCSPGHSLGLGEHCNSAANIVSGLLEYENHWERKPSWNSMNVVNAMLLHDCGKPYTQSFDGNGNVQYFSHPNIGAYEALFYDYPNKEIDVSYVSALITHHMAPYFWKKSRNKQFHALKIWGRDFYEDILAMHMADEMAR